MKKKKTKSSIWRVEVVNYTKKNKELDIRYERYVKTKWLFGIRVYYRQFDYDCDEIDKSNGVGFK